MVLIFGVVIPGTIYSRPGAIMASPDEFSITIKGKGGHGAKPHETIDGIIMAEFILSAKNHFSYHRSLKEAVLTFGMVQAGSSDSVIPDSAFCKGTVRTFDTELQAHVQEKMDKLLQGLALANDVTYDMGILEGIYQFIIMKKLMKQLNKRQMIYIYVLINQN